MNAKIQNLIALCLAACATTVYAADERGMTGFYAIADLDANLVQVVGFVRRSADVSVVATPTAP